MTPRELRIALERLDLSPADAAARLGAPRGAVRRWLAGAEPIPAPAAVLLETWTTNPQVRASLRARGEVQP